MQMLVADFKKDHDNLQIFAACDDLVEADRDAEFLHRLALAQESRGVVSRTGVLGLDRGLLEPWNNAVKNIK
ncbi:hypothetical protein PoB_004798800 [Plakobranchus ocellatus]|uniref:Uncharacterized protein n=1 Tax=Plakobranchus ocellatus TaxID=259542 RepID=A0AAV4BQS6_9GAST|nr:hypothetical protein PoB_004798800 [Plakobranchus ocellatus]